MRFPTFLLLTLAACATAPQRKSSPASAGRPATERTRSRVARELAVMSIGLMPPLELRHMVTGSTVDMDRIMHGDSPSASGMLPCATGTDIATWQTPASCGLATGTNYWTLSTNTLNAASGWSLSLNAGLNADGDFGWSAYPATSTNLLRYTFGDNWSGMQAGSGDRLQIYAYHGVEIRGGRAALSTPAAATGGSASDPSLVVVSSASGGGLRIDTSAGTAGTAISWSGRTTVVLPTQTLSPAAPIAANSCAILSSAATLTGAAAGADCIVGRPSGAAANPVVTCVALTNSIQMQFCNVSTGTVTPTAGTYSARVFNP